MKRRQFLSCALLNASAIIIATGCSYHTSSTVPDREYLRSLLSNEILSKIDKENALNIIDFNSNIQAIVIHDYKNNNVVWVNSSLYSYIELRS